MRTTIAALLLLPATALAASAFDGTWKLRTDSFKVNGKPDVFVVVDGMYDCSSCVPEIKVKADGTDQKVTGHAYYDTVNVKVLSPTSIEVAQTKAGKPVVSVTYSVSADGKTLSNKFVDHTGAKTATGSFTETRVAAAAAGAHAVSGSWQPGQVTDANEAARTYNYAMTADAFSMHWNGQHYDAKFDGGQYPVAGDPGHTKVTLKKVDDNTVDETDYRLGKVTDEIHLAAAKDGKSIDVTDKDVQHGQTTTFTLDKQQ
jgi:hypothetical protein